MVLGTDLLEWIIVDVWAISLMGRVNVIACEAWLARLIVVQVIANEGRLKDLTTI